MKPVMIGPLRIETPLALAPMAGVTDRAFRELCRRLGAGLACSEMTTADPRLWKTAKSQTRLDHRGESGPIAVQIAGSEPEMLANAARHCVAQGAQIVDINMGCPAKKVCRADAGSALMRDERRVGEICRAVVAAVSVPVTLKIRTGWSHDGRNGLAVARIAEEAGIAALAVHGRTREDHYQGPAEYATIASIKRAVSIPVFANGDVDGPEKALQVLAQTGADGLMVGRAALGRPWIFREIAYFLATGCLLPAPTRAEVGQWLLEQMDDIYDLYGFEVGVRIARKHIQWYGRQVIEDADFWPSVCKLQEAKDQRSAVHRAFAAPARLDSMGLRHSEHSLAA